MSRSLVADYTKRVIGEGDEMLGLMEICKILRGIERRLDGVESRLLRIESNNQVKKEQMDRLSDIIVIDSVRNGYYQVIMVGLKDKDGLTYVVDVSYDNLMALYESIMRSGVGGIVEMVDYDYSGVKAVEGEDGTWEIISI